MSLNINSAGEQTGRVAIVTGGSSGIGRGAANELARQGASVVVHGLTLDESNLVVQEIRVAGGIAIATAGPIDDPETATSAVSLALAEYGHLDVLVTSAGIQRYGTVFDTPIEVWDEVFNVNVKGVFLACKAALPKFARVRRGRLQLLLRCKQVQRKGMSPRTHQVKGRYFLSLVQSLSMKGRLGFG